MSYRCKGIGWFDSSIIIFLICFVFCWIPPAQAKLVQALSPSQLGNDNFGRVFFINQTYTDKDEMRQGMRSGSREAMLKSIAVWHQADLKVAIVLTLFLFLPRAFGTFLFFFNLTPRTAVSFFKLLDEMSVPNWCNNLVPQIIIALCHTQKHDIGLLANK